MAGAQILLARSFHHIIGAAFLHKGCVNAPFFYFKGFHKLGAVEVGASSVYQRKHQAFKTCPYDLFQGLFVNGALGREACGRMFLTAFGRSKIWGQSENPVVFLLPFPILRAQFG